MSPTSWHLSRPRVARWDGKGDLHESAVEQRGPSNESGGSGDVGDIVEDVVRRLHSATFESGEAFESGESEAEEG